MFNKMHFKKKIFVVLLAHMILLEKVVNAAETQERASSEVSRTVVQTQNGPIQGIVKDSRNSSNPFVAFLGLRYSDPPPRFKPPLPLSEQWTNIKKADRPGSICAQVGETGVLEGTEDCNFLNVYVPLRQLENEWGTQKLPVMVYFHGGGFAFGDGTSYGAEYFMENEDVILVTLNYRLGALGFLTVDDEIPSNIGLRDQIMALKWVKTNIQSFKGDPENVTIFGNSAGSAAIHYLLMSRLTKGLFHRAIMQSSAFSFWSYSPNPRETALDFAKHSGCLVSEDRELQSKEVRECLEKLSTKELLQAQATFKPRWPTLNGISRFGPTNKESQRNPLFSQPLKSFFTKDDGVPMEYPNKVPVMLGSTRDEGSTLFAACVLSEEGSLEKLDHEWDQLAPRTFCFDDYFTPKTLSEISKRARKYYFGVQDKLTKDNANFLSDMYTDTLFLLPVMSAAIQMAKDEEFNVYPYIFAYSGGWSLRDALKLKERFPVGHADELRYLFPHEVLGPPFEANSTAEKLSKRLIRLWTSFAKTGVPAASDWTQGLDVDWKPIKVKPGEAEITSFELLRIDTKLKLIEADFIDRIEFWRNLLNEVALSDDVLDTKATSKTEL